MPGQKENLQEKLLICLLVKNSQVTDFGDM